MRQDRRCSLAPSRTTRPTSRRSSLARSPSAPRHWFDQPGSLARLVLAVAARRGVPVAYVPGLVMRRAADLYPGESKTDRRDAFVLADTGRTRRHQVHWLDAGDRTPGAAARSQRLRHRPRRRCDAALQPPAGCAHQCFPGPGARTAPNSTLRGHGTCSPATRHRRRWPRRVAAASRGRSGSARRASPALTEAVTGALDAQTVVIPGSVAMGRVIAEVATELDRTQQRRERLGVEIGELFEAHPFGLILGSLPGVGPRTGARMLAEIGDISRFVEAGQLRRPCPGHPPVRQQYPGPDPEPPRQSPAQERDVPLRLRLAARPRLARAPQAGRGKETHRPSSASRAGAATSSAMLRSRTVSKAHDQRSPLDGVNSAGFRSPDEEDGDTTWRPSDDRKWPHLRSSDYARVNVNPPRRRTRSVGKGLARYKS